MSLIYCEYHSFSERCIFSLQDYVFLVYEAKNVQV